MASTNQMLQEKLAARAANGAVPAIQDVGAPAPAQQPQSAIGTVLAKYHSEFSKVLPPSMTVDRFLRVCETKIKTNPKLMDACAKNMSSFLGAAMQMAQWGLDPSIPNEAHFVPRWNKQRGMADICCDIGYKGLKKLALRAARNAGAPYRTLAAQPIYSNDTYERSRGEQPKLVHSPAPFGEPKGELIGFYAVAKDADGGLDFVEMTAEEVAEHKQRFSKAKTGPFAGDQNFEAYGVKTVMRLLCTRCLDLSPELAHAVYKDIETETGETNEVAQPYDALQPPGLAFVEDGEEVPEHHARQLPTVLPDNAEEGHEVDAWAYIIEGRKSPYCGMSLNSIGLEELILIQGFEKRQAGLTAKDKQAIDLVLADFDGGAEDDAS